MTQDVAAATREAYRRWAPLYPPSPHNPLMRAEHRAMVDLCPDVSGKRALDLASGSGRYSRLLTEKNASAVVAVDFCAAMMRGAGTQRVCADMMNLPFLDEAFDIVVSGLAIGHAPSIDAWMTEIARVLTRGGALLYSDFHPEAARAGLTRSFKDADDRTVTVPHCIHDISVQENAAAKAGMTIEAVREIRVGLELTEAFAKSEGFYGQWHGLPIALVVRATK